MRAGRLRNKVTLQEKSVTLSAEGEEVVTWVNVATVWAGVEPLTGREYAIASAEYAEVTTRVVMRYRPGVVPEQRVVFGEHTYNVRSVIDPDMRHKELQLMCDEVLA